MRVFWIAAIFLALLAPVGRAQENAPLRRLVTANDDRGWEAVGRLDIGGRAFCTGALISPDLVLTAAHCLYDGPNGPAVDARAITFRAGWRNGRANAVSKVAIAVAHPNFAFETDGSPRTVGYDVALLRLAAPIRKTSVIPFETGERPRKGADVAVVSYAVGRAQSPSLQEKCRVLARRSGTLVLSCSVSFGSSGAPVFSVSDDGKARIVSVISAKAQIGGRTVALSTQLQKPLADLMAIMADKEMPKADTRTGVRVFTLGSGGAGRSGTGGARFLRP